MKIVICVDVQNDFIKGGRLAYGYPQKDIVPSIAKYVSTIEASGEYVVLMTRDYHKKTEFSKDNQAVPIGGYLSTLEGKKLPIEHCIFGTEGFNIADELVNAVKNPCIIDKYTFGSISLPDLIKDYSKNYCHKQHYSEDLVEEIQICGFCTSICVISNALILRANFPNTKITIVENLCGDIDKESHCAAIAVARNCQIDIEKIKM